MEEGGVGLSSQQTTNVVCSVVLLRLFISRWRTGWRRIHSNFLLRSCCTTGLTHRSGSKQCYTKSSSEPSSTLEHCSGGVLRARCIVGQCLITTMLRHILVLCTFKSTKSLLPLLQRWPSNLGRVELSNVCVGNDS